MIENLIAQIRPTSRFATYNPQTDSQTTALERLRRLSVAITRKAEDIQQHAHPFERGRVVFVSGPPGVGKTHLVEATINEVIEQVPTLRERLFLFRGDFTVRNITGTDDFDDCPVVFIDDLFAERQSVADLHPKTDLPVLMDFITAIYDRRLLVVVTSNLSLMSEIAVRIPEVDKVGRTTSRLRELLANSGEIAIAGPDYREMLAKQLDADDIFGEL